MTEVSPLFAVICGPKRHYRYRIISGEAVIEDHTEAQLGGTYADPPIMRGRTPNGQRRWSQAAVTREAAHQLAHQLDLDRDALRAAAPWDEGQATSWPGLRRLMVKTPEMASALPECFGARPGTRYVQATVHPLRKGVDETPVALDPGGDIARWWKLHWVGQSTGSGNRVTTDPRDAGAVLLESLDYRAVLWSKPPRTVPIESVTVFPELVRRVGRVSGVIDADEVGLDNLSEHRPVHDHGDPAAFVQGEVTRLGPRPFARLYGVPLKTVERLSLGGHSSRATLRRIMGASVDLAADTCGLDGCDHPVGRPNALYCPCCPNHKDRAYRHRRKSRRSPADSDPTADLPACRRCGVIMLGSADRGGTCRACEGLPS